jgi:hypothetical protein
LQALFNLLYPGFNRARAHRAASALAVVVVGDARAMGLQIGTKQTGRLRAQLLKRVDGLVYLALPEEGFCLAEAFERAAYLVKVLLEMKPVEDF